METFSKYIAVGMLALASFFFSKDAKAQEINGPTPWEVVGNMYSQPNIYMQVGRNKLDYYGSGDVNNDKKIDSLDNNEILGAINDRADIDEDGMPGTELDKSKLS